MAIFNSYFDITRGYRWTIIPNGAGDLAELAGWNPVLTMACPTS